MEEPRITRAEAEILVSQLRHELRNARQCKERQRCRLKITGHLVIIAAGSAVAFAVTPDLIVVAAAQIPLLAVELYDHRNGIS